MKLPSTFLIFFEKKIIKSKKQFFILFSVMFSFFILLFQNCSQQAGLDLTILASDGFDTKLSSSSSQDLDDEGTPFTVEANFSQEVESLDASMINVTNGKITKIEGSGRLYLIEVLPTGIDVTLEIKKGTVKKKKSKMMNQVSNVISKRVGTFAPEVAIETLVKDIKTVDDDFETVITFSKPYKMTTLDDLIVTNATVKNLVVLDELCLCKYKFTVSPESKKIGEFVKVKFPKAIFKNKWNIENKESNELSLKFQSTKPVITLTSEAPAEVTGPFKVVATFSIPWSTLGGPMNASHIDIKGGQFESIEDFKNASGQIDVFKKVIQVKPTADLIQVSIKANVLKNKYDLSNDVSNALARTYVNSSFKITYPANNPVITKSSITNYLFNGNCPTPNKEVSVKSFANLMNVLSKVMCNTDGKFTMNVDFSSQPSGPLKLQFLTFDSTDQPVTLIYNTTIDRNLFISIDFPISSINQAAAYVVTKDAVKEFQVGGECSETNASISLIAVNTNSMKPTEKTDEVKVVCNSTGRWSAKINLNKFNIASGFKLSNNDFYKLNAVITESNPINPATPQTNSDSLLVKKTIGVAPPSLNNDGPYYVEDGQTIVADLFANDTATSDNGVITYIGAQGTCSKCSSFSVSSSGKLNYTPKASVESATSEIILDNIGSESLTYSFHDQYGQISMASAKVTIMTKHTWTGKVSSEWSNLKNWCGSVDLSTNTCNGLTSSADLPKQKSNSFAGSTVILDDTCSANCEIKNTRAINFYKLILSAGAFSQNHDIAVAELIIKDGVFKAYRSASDDFNPYKLSVSQNLYIAKKEGFEANNGNVILDPLLYLGIVKLNASDVTFFNLKMQGYGGIIQNESSKSVKVVNLTLADAISSGTITGGSYLVSKKLNLTAAGKLGSSDIILSGGSDSVISVSADVGVIPYVSGIIIDTQGMVNISGSMNIQSKFVYKNGKVSTLGSIIKFSPREYSPIVIDTTNQNGKVEFDRAEFYGYGSSWNFESDFYAKELSGSDPAGGSLVGKDIYLSKKLDLKNFASGAGGSSGGTTMVYMQGGVNDTHEVSFYGRSPNITFNTDGKVTLVSSDDQSFYGGNFKIIKAQLQKFGWLTFKYGTIDVPEGFEFNGNLGLVSEVYSTLTIKNKIIVNGDLNIASGSTMKNSTSVTGANIEFKKDLYDSTLNNQYPYNMANTLVAIGSNMQKVYSAGSSGYNLIVNKDENSSLVYANDNFFMKDVIVNSGKISSDFKTNFTCYANSTTRIKISQNQNQFKHVEFVGANCKFDLADSVLNLSGDLSFGSAGYTAKGFLSGGKINVEGNVYADSGTIERESIYFLADNVTDLESFTEVRMVGSTDSYIDSNIYYTKDGADVKEFVKIHPRITIAKSLPAKVKLNSQYIGYYLKLESSNLVINDNSTLLPLILNYKSNGILKLDDVNNSYIELGGLLYNSSLIKLPANVYVKNGASYNTSFCPDWTTTSCKSLLGTFLK
ncbi:MAG: hypothetical protein L6Q37_05570 [Bdellovibrionaceae bacterium]|nr:hypothetical protein [Pseudobdellovibrionaceae bacterium]NUM57022.1 hypothetical protein [Pseudobdellovibrionaceae bacterium]